MNKPKSSRAPAAPVSGRKVLAASKQMEKQYRSRTFWNQQSRYNDQKSEQAWHANYTNCEQRKKRISWRLIQRGCICVALFTGIALTLWRTK